MSKDKDKEKDERKKREQHPDTTIIEPEKIIKWLQRINRDKEKKK